MAAQPIRLTYELRQEIRLRQSERAKIDSGKNRRIEDSVAKDHELLHPPKKAVSVESTTLDDKSKRCPVEDCKFSSKTRQGVRVHMARMHSRIRAVDRDAMLANIPEDEVIARQVREHGKRDVRQLPAVVPDAVIDFKVGDKPYHVMTVLEKWGFFGDALLFNAVMHIACARVGEDVEANLREAIVYIEKKLERV